MAALPIIEKFADNNDARIATVKMPLDKLTGRTMQVRVGTKSDFIHSSGETINRRWLSIDTLPMGSGASIGVGVNKAKAVCAVALELRAWVRRGGAPPT